MYSHTRIHPDRPSPTILKTVGVDRLGRANNGLYHWRFPRLLTVPELKRLGSFPDAYQFASTGDPVDDFVNTWAGIGNSVPPLMTRAVATHPHSPDPSPEVMICPNGLWQVVRVG